MRRFIKPLFALLVASGLLLALRYVGQAPPGPHLGASISEALSGENSAGFERAMAPRPLVFPADAGPHPSFQTEWWYFTGNLSDDSGHRFGYQLTFFRRALLPPDKSPPRASAWATTELYLAHFALSDIDGGAFYPFERLSRGAAGLAGAQPSPFRVWLEDWSASETAATAEAPLRLVASEGAVAIDLLLTAQKPIVLHGDRGLSRKSSEPGNASYYYSQTRIGTLGSISLAGRHFTVHGNSWLDREWSTSVLSPQQSGWDWFAIQLSDGRDLMLYQLRRRDGSTDPASSGSLIDRDGQLTPLSQSAFQITPTGRWRSPHSGASYPAGWHVTVATNPPLDLTITPLQPDQELPLRFTYWEGAVSVTGPTPGLGYVELTGYSQP